MPVERSGFVSDPVNHADIPDLAYGQPIVADMDDHDHLEQLIRDALGLGRLVGGVLTIGFQREEVAPGVTITTGAVWHYNSFVPRTGNNGAAPDVAAAAEAHAAETPANASDAGAAPIE